MLKIFQEQNRTFWYNASLLCSFLIYSQSSQLIRFDNMLVGCWWQQQQYSMYGYMYVCCPIKMQYCPTSVYLLSSNCYAMENVFCKCTHTRVGSTRSQKLCRQPCLPETACLYIILYHFSIVHIFLKTVILSLHTAIHNT